MNLYPAIDLKDGVCVRLLHGELSNLTRYNEYPADQARRFADMGFQHIHVVDLDGAFGGASVNHNAVNAILDATGLPVQLGGGIRDMYAVDRWLESGVSRVILGTAAVRDPEFVKLAARTHPDGVAVGIDARNGRVAVQGWAESTDMSAVELAKAFEGCGVAALIVTDISRDGAKTGVAALIVTDISRDGAKTGVNVDFTGELADAVSIPVIASGGLKGVDDIRALKARPGRPIHGAILGRALYDGDIDPAEALAAAG